MDPVKKVTEFEGFASGDCECFCFDTRTVTQADADEEATHEDWEESHRRSREARIYPSDLLPEVEGYRVRGKWRITVEFEPESPDLNGK